MTKRQIMEKIPFKLLAVFLLLSAGIAAGGFSFYKQQRARSVAHSQEDLNTIAQLKSEEITAWRKERYGDAFVITRSQQFAASVRRWYRNPGDKKLKDYIYKRLDAFRIYETYKDVILVDPNGKARMFIDQGGSEILSQTTLNFVKEAERQNRIIFSDFYFCGKCREVHLDVITPLHDGEKNAGALILRINPDKFLYPLIQRWPSVSKSGETVLVRRESNEIVYLNDLRHKKGAAMKLRLPLADTLLPAAMAALGKEGMVEGRDYRGVPVVAAVKHIADSPWYMVAKVDKDEIFAPLKRQAGNVMFVTILLILALAAVLSFIWQADRREFYKRQYQLELDKKALNKHYDYLTKYANDIIFLIDDKLKVVEINDRAQEIYGYTREELIGMDADQVRADDQRAQLKPQMNKLFIQKGLLYETMHKRKDGSTFPVEISSRTIEIEGKNYLQDIVRDITERKQYELKLRDRNEELEAANQELVAAEEELRHQMDELQRSKEEIANEKIWADTLIQSAPNMVIGLGERSKILLFNSYAEKLTGYQADEVLGKNWIDIFILEGQRQQLYGVWDQIIKNKYVEHYYENQIITKNNEARLIFWSNSFLTEKGQFKMVLSLGQDITERKMVEIALQNSEDRYRKAEAVGGVGNWEYNIQTATFWGSDEAKRIYGFDPDRNDFTADEVENCIPERERVHQALVDLIEQEKEYDLEFEIHPKNYSAPRIITSKAKLHRDDQGKPLKIVGVIQDITERKKAENELLESKGRLRTLIDTLPEYIWLKNVEGVYLACNPKFEEFFGAKEPEIVGKTDYDFVDKKLADFFRGKDDEAIKARKPCVNEEEVTRAVDGQKIVLETIKTPMFDAQGNLIGVLGISHDITERKQVEEALHESEKRVRLKLDAVLSPEGDISTLELSDIIDSEKIQKLMDELYKVTSIGIGIIDRNGNVLVGTGWQEICTKYHRVNPETCRLCVESDLKLSQDVLPGTLYRCKNNMWDMASPIKLGGVLLGNIYLGQFFFDDEQVDSEAFRRQARRYGFNEQEYMAALDRVPRWNRKTVDAMMLFYTTLAELIGNLSYANVKLASALEDRKRAEEKIGQQLSELQRWQAAMLDREDRVMELKKEINELLVKLGQPQKYGNR